MEPVCFLRHRGIIYNVFVSVCVCDKVEFKIFSQAEHILCFSHYIDLQSHLCLNSTVKFQFLLLVPLYLTIFLLLLLLYSTV